ncbi:boophilin-H2-like [Sitodiplosis mosellana]|uniref:boophilin-H2-like n=1 Tax=Sitodiplosis mosellana TaxID=263140 RepID=UPI0024447A20|nr:boophilin-H2-like [Sitodiplosis mosellana]
MKLVCLLTIILFAVLVTSRPQKKEDKPTKELTPEEICALDSSDGNCEAYYPKFFFNSKVRRCELFLYGGCGGNANRFNNMRECESKCGNFKFKKSNCNNSHHCARAHLNAEEICALPKSDGNERTTCLAYLQSFFHNSTSGNCEEFIYGGCGGNENIFSSKDECEKFCKGIKNLDGATEKPQD